MPKVKKDPHDWPSLNQWLYSIDLTFVIIQKYFLYSALVNYFPGAKNGSHLIPTQEEILKERGRLQKTIKEFDPEIVVPIGRLSIAYCLGKVIEPLEKNIGQQYLIDPYSLFGKQTLVIPLPHPSGASTWRYRPEGKKLIPVALNLLKTNLQEL